MRCDEQTCRTIGKPVFSQHYRFTGAMLFDNSFRAGPTPRLGCCAHAAVEAQSPKVVAQMVEG